MPVMPGATTPRGGLDVDAAVGKSYFDEELIRCTSLIRSKRGKAAAGRGILLYLPFPRLHPFKMIYIYVLKYEEGDERLNNFSRKKTGLKYCLLNIMSPRKINRVDELLYFFFLFRLEPTIW